MKTVTILGLAAVAAIGAGCAALIGLSPADQQACTNAADQAALGNHQTTFVADVLGCSVSSPGDPAAASACIQGKEGISKACADCSAANGACASQKCSGMCLDGAMSAPCQTCIASQCNAALIACAGTPLYACVGAADMTALGEHASTFETDVKMCGIMYSNDEDAVVTCIENQDGVSQPCALCVAQEGLCVVGGCPMCINDPTSTSCSSCVDAECTPVFTLCSGLPADAGP